MHLPTYVGLLDASLRSLADAFRQVSDGHGEEPDVHHLCKVLAGQIDGQLTMLVPVVRHYGEKSEQEPERLHATGLDSTRSGGVGLLRDLQDLYMLGSFVEMTWTVVGQAAQGLRDRELLHIVHSCEQDTAQQLQWLRTRIKQAAPQALIAAK
ncbi:hypothetical protein SAMN05216266_12471 [Amycolatopsis marina]|uniref:Ferritin-like metal-binding protein YciE n=1 Tax=Amycolatopsis marina TaxID=490629 RepID=A0A1I1CCJ5_9PSEU|nr:hypothetical protein [Amycolatopsis marina]SFB59842.1 hypothetical protein SAMN05216266_12471 [Amycolatopsis marina]